MTEDEMAGWRHRLNEHGFGQTQGVGDAVAWHAVILGGHKESDKSEQLN